MWASMPIRKPNSCISVVPSTCSWLTELRNETRQEEWLRRVNMEPRHGTQCVIQYPTNRNPAQSVQENAITAFGPRLYNSFTKYLRDIDSVKIEKFKFEPDKFLELIPDEPNMPNYVTVSGSNSILDQLTHLRAQGIYQSGWVSDSAMEQS